MSNPTFDIQLATNSLHSRVSCNGEDISSAIRSVTVQQIAGEMPIVTLQLAQGEKGASFRLQAEAIMKLQEEVETKI